MYVPAPIPPSLLTFPDLPRRIFVVVHHEVFLVILSSPMHSLIAVCSLSIMLLARLMLNLHEAAAVGITSEEPNTIELGTLRFATVQMTVDGLEPSLSTEK
jgi:hypothetical protein